MKTRSKRLLGLLLSAATALSALPCEAIAAAVPAAANSLPPALQAESTAPAAPLGDIWLAISELETEAGAVCTADYAALLPQIVQVVRAYEDYRDGSLEYEDGILFWWSDDRLNGYDPALRADPDHDSDGIVTFLDVTALLKKLLSA